MPFWAQIVDAVVIDAFPLPDDIVPGRDVMPPDQTYVECGADVRAGWTYDGEKFVEVLPEPLPMPDLGIPDVSSAQAKIQLSRAGFLLPVKASVEAIGGEVEIWFTDARTWQRNNPHVIEIGAGLALSPAEIDDLFREAAKIDA
jgi:hypothetical protein